MSDISNRVDHSVGRLLLLEQAPRTWKSRCRVRDAFAVYFKEMCPEIFATLDEDALHDLAETATTAACTELRGYAERRIREARNEPMTAHQEP